MNIVQLQVPAICVIVAVAIIATSPTANAEPANALWLKVSQHEGRTDTPIKVEEAATLRGGVYVKLMSHRVWRVGMYHRTLKRFILFGEPALPLVSPVEANMPGLWDSRMGTHGIALTKFDNDRFGKAFAFQVRDPGVYSISAEWSLFQEYEGKTVTSKITSNPVLLFIKPSDDFEIVAKAREELGETGEFESLKLQEFLEQYFDRHDADADFKSTVLPFPIEPTPNNGSPH